MKKMKKKNTARGQKKNNKSFSFFCSDSFQGDQKEMIALRSRSVRTPSQFWSA